MNFLKTNLHIGGIKNIIYYFIMHFHWYSKIQMFEDIINNKIDRIGYTDLLLLLLLLYIIMYIVTDIFSYFKDTNSTKIVFLK